MAAEQKSTYADYFKQSFDSLSDAVFGMLAWFNIKSGSDIDDACYAGCLKLGQTLVKDNDAVFYEEGNARLATRVLVKNDDFWKAFAQADGAIQGQLGPILFFPINDRFGELEGRSEDIRRQFFIAFEYGRLTSDAEPRYYPVGYIGMNVLENQPTDQGPAAGIEKLLFWGSLELCKKIEDYLYVHGTRQVNKVRRPSKIKQVDGIGNGQLALSEFAMDEEAGLYQSLPCFYPWIKMDLNNYLREFITAKENCAVLYGEPGTGKSTLCRTLIFQNPCNALIASSAEVVNDPTFVKLARDYFNNLRTEPERKYGFSKLKEKFLLKPDEEEVLLPNILVVEEADLLLQKRKAGNFSMQNLLNELDGILKAPMKVIFVTNLTDLNDIDEALLRPGRCYDALPFRSLTKEEGLVVRKELGLPEMEIETDYASLAEVTNMKVERQFQKGRVKSRYGFV
jgi:energy-coupling factor transporter ATP-binding protein EcfA2